MDSSNESLFMKACGISYMPIGLENVLRQAIKFCHNNKLDWCMDDGASRDDVCFSIFPDIHDDWTVSIETGNIKESIILAVSVAHSNLNRQKQIEQDRKVVDFMEWKKKKR